jgi:hypothetical protein
VNRVVVPPVLVVRDVHVVKDTIVHPFIQQYLVAQHVEACLADADRARRAAESTLRTFRPNSVVAATFFARSLGSNDTGRRLSARRPERFWPVRDAWGVAGPT